MHKELSAIKRAIARLEKSNELRIPITFLVVQKRHHVRFFPTDAKNSDDKNFNVQAGTIVDTEITGNLYTLQVIDTGAGIPDFALDHVFERFYSLPRPNRGKSSGLGLAFVKEVAHLHNGNIMISNRKDNIKGVVATLTLKIH